MLKAVCLLTSLLVIAAGCGRNLYHYHRTVVGLDISGNVAGETPSGHVTLGYSRRLVVLMPPDIQKAIESPSASAGLPPTVFCTQVKASLGGVNAFREVLATGAPAIAYAKQQVAARAALPPSDTKLRNFVCPGYEIPLPDKSAGSQGQSALPRALAQ